MSGVAFVDTETCGLDPIRNPIWEIAVIVDDVEHVWTQRVPHGLHVVEDGDEPPNDVYVSRWVLENTRFGTDYQMVDDDRHLSPRESIHRFAELVDGRHLVGAVPSFDEERLRRLYLLWVKQGATRFPWHYHLIDVEAMAVGYLAREQQQIRDDGGDHGGPMPLPWNSDVLGLLLGVDPTPEDERHTALGDARWAKRMYEAMVG